MKKTIIILVALQSIINLSNAQTFLQKGLDFPGTQINDETGLSVSMPDINTIAIGSPKSDLNSNNGGKVLIARWSTAFGGWEQKGNFIDPGGSFSGRSVSMPDSNTVGIGSWEYVGIYRWNSANGGAWVQKGVNIEREVFDDDFGFSISMPDSNTIAIGAPRNDGNGNASGHVRIYKWDGVAWTQKGSDIDGEASGDFSGCSVSMPDTNTVAIGAGENNGNGNNSGHVRIYNWNGSTWVQKGGDIDGEGINDYFGGTVSMPDANTVAIGAKYNAGSSFDEGHVRIYRWNGSTWVQKGNDIDGEASGDYSGCSVSMPDSNTVAIGAHFNDGNGQSSGQARIYRWNTDNGGYWMQKGIDINGAVSNNEAGFSVSMPDSNTVAIGAPSIQSGGYGGTKVYHIQNNVGIIENSFGNILKVYPNPTKGVLNIDFGTSHNELNVIITNNIGQNILKKKYENSNLIQLYIPGEASIYFIEVISGERKALLKVVKE